MANGREEHIICFISKKIKTKIVYTKTQQFLPSTKQPPSEVTLIRKRVNRENAFFVWSASNEKTFRIYSFYHSICSP